MSGARDFEVAANELRWRCNPDRLGFETTDEVECCPDIIGQDRALDAIRLGLEITSPGYNIYVSGLTGTGKSTTIQQLLRSMRHEDKQLLDRCYVHNFRAPEKPRCVSLPAGKGTEFKRRMAELLETLKVHIPKALESDRYSARQKEVINGLKTRQATLAADLDILIQKKGFQIHEVQYGPFTRPAVLPVIDEQPVEMEKLPAEVEAGNLASDDYDRIKQDHEVLMTKMEEVLKKTRDVDRKIVARISELEVNFVSPIVDTCIKEAQDGFPEEVLRSYFNELREYSVDNLEIFVGAPESDEGQDPRTRFVEFEVNLIVDNSRTTDVPVIIETAPRYSNLFGVVERAGDSRGDQRPDFTMIRAGSLVQANGGFLVLNLNDVFEETSVWPALKRSLKYQKVSIQGMESPMMGPATALKPEPIEIDVKVVLIGEAESYQFLYHYDEDFKKIFKVKADFDNEMPNTQQNLNRYCQFVRNVTDAEHLLPFHKSAVAACLEQGAEISGRQDRLTTKFSDVADIIRESHYWAVKSGDTVVMEEHVEKAVSERIRRISLPEEKMAEMLIDGTILLDIDGRKVGQVNGLAVFDLGDYSFGKPVRITVETSMGRAGIINIEREAEMSGKTYNKGSLILEGYLRRRFAQERPLAMSASICFEQSYGGVDGDSASSTEIYGMLSSLSDLALRQDLAVTGSVNQKGEVQPIGGVNEKVHGFYDLCRMKGLTGEQGVIIPKLNQKDLMLRKDVIKSIVDGRFHIYAVGTIDEGVEVLTGVRAGEQQADGSFEDGTVYARVDAKLAKFAEQIKDYLETGDEKE